MSKIVIALGGNALGKNPQEQHATIEKTSKYLVDLVEAGNQIVITHGNGPQVGMIYKWSNVTRLYWLPTTTSIKR